jgi:uncharacterized protein YjiS (DUF1127 family)
VVELGEVLTRIHERERAADLESARSTSSGRLPEERLGVDWSGQRAEHGRDGISPAALRVARDALGRMPDERRPLADLSEDDLLRDLGLVDADDHLLRAGE